MSGVNIVSGLTVRVPTPDGWVNVRVWPADAPVAGRPVLFTCHGWTDSGEVFGPLATALGRRWTIVAPDAPGHGGTPWTPTASYEVAEHALGAIAVLDALPAVAGRRAPVVAFGHSMGALTAARVATARPDVVRHLVLEEPARTTPRQVPSPARTRATVQALQAVDHAGRLAQLALVHPRWPADEADPWARSRAEVDLAQFDVPVDWGEPLIALLADVACPVTIVRGEPARGGQVSKTGARRCGAACRAGAEVIALAAGHNPRREARKPFVTALVAVLGRYEA